MKIYNVIVKDRHCDPYAIPFADKDNAIECARKIAKENCRCKEYYREVKVKGWLFFAVYSGESDAVWVTEHYLG